MIEKKCMLIIRLLIKELVRSAEREHPIGYKK